MYEIVEAHYNRAGLAEALRKGEREGGITPSKKKGYYY